MLLSLGLEALEQRRWETAKTLCQQSKLQLMELIHFEPLSEENQSLREDHQNLGLVVNYLNQNKIQKKSPFDAVDVKKVHALVQAIDIASALKSGLFSEAFRGTSQI